MGWETVGMQQDLGKGVFKKFDFKLTVISSPPKSIWNSRNRRTRKVTNDTRTSYVVVIETESGPSSSFEWVLWGPQMETERPCMTWVGFGDKYDPLIQVEMRITCRMQNVQCPNTSNSWYDTRQKIKSVLVPECQLPFAISNLPFANTSNSH